jgi:NAD(P)-dependent dehydrogenase (short-subunit alcohol dehydrogenase family)
MAKWTAADIPDQTGRTILITGANSGLGLRSAEALAAKGARVLMACRNATKAATAREAVQAKATGAPPEVVPLDLSSLASVAACVERLAGELDHLDVLMNNAGIMAVPKAQTVDGFESQIGTNHLGHFALAGQLMPLLLAAPEPRVVTVASNAHKLGRVHVDDLFFEHRRYSRWGAYGQTKLANLLFSTELQRRAVATGTSLTAVAAHPGYAASPITWARSRSSTPRRCPTCCPTTTGAPMPSASSAATRSASVAPIAPRTATMRLACGSAARSSPASPTPGPHRTPELALGMWLGRRDELLEECGQAERIVALDAVPGLGHVLHARGGLTTA